jgi:hypothetical protein
MSEHAERSASRATSPTMLVHRVQARLTLQLSREEERRASAQLAALQHQAAIETARRKAAAEPPLARQAG